jgi:hypothetical protein
MATKNTKIQIPIFSEGQRLVILVDEDNASLIGSYHNAIYRLLRTNKPEAVAKFEGKYVTDINGRRYVLETRPNKLYELTATDPDIMDRMYRIIR